MIPRDVYIKLVRSFIHKWKLNQKFLAKQMEMPKGTFNNKLSEAHPSTFSYEETKALIEIFEELESDLKELRQGI